MRCIYLRLLLGFIGRLLGAVQREPAGGRMFGGVVRLWDFVHFAVQRNPARDRLHWRVVRLGNFVHFAVQREPAWDWMLVGVVHVGDVLSFAVRWDGEFTTRERVLERVVHVGNFVHFAVQRGKTLHRLLVGVVHQSDMRGRLLRRGMRR